MKRAVLFIFLMFAYASLFAQGAASDLNAQAVSTASSTHYSVKSELGQENADSVAKTMEAFFQFYQSYFRFDDTSMLVKLNVTLYKEKTGFDSRLLQVLGQTREDFVYLHYQTPEKCELLAFVKNEEEFLPSLAHQGFIQYLKAFIANPPMWLREGFAVYFEQLRLDPKTGSAVMRSNNAWLDTVKSYKARNTLIGVDAFLKMNPEKLKESIQVFYPQAWMFVVFLSETDRKPYNRFLWDSISSLEPDATLDDNSGRIASAAKTWIGYETLKTEFDSFIDAKKTFAERVTTGIAFYNEKKYEEAGMEFKLAVAMNETNHVPYYYLGLISYYDKDYAAADNYYRTSLQMGCDLAVGNYALGVNAFADTRFEDARTHLEFAKSVNPTGYGSRADELLNRIK